MAKKDTDLFDRLRQAGLRKRTATAISQVSEGADKKAQGTARAAVKDLRALADEIEAGLPAAMAASDGEGAKRPPAPRTRRSTPRSTRRSAAGTSRTAAAKPKPRRSTRRASAGTRSRARSN